MLKNTRLSLSLSPLPGLLILLFSTISLSPLFTESGTHTVEAYTSTGFGDSTYFLDVNDGSYGVQSLLSFPLDAVFSGLRYEYAPYKASWKAGIELGTNITTPRSLMLDYDWWYYVGYSSVPFSYTESNLEFNSFDITASGEKQLAYSPQTRIYLTGGYNLLFLHQMITDYSGWQYRDDVPSGGDGEYEAYYISAKGNAIEYWILYHIVSAGIAWESDLDSRLGIRIHAAPSLGVFFDSDDHILRSKLSTANGFGYGFSGEVSIVYSMDSPEGGNRSYYWKLFSSYRWFYSNGIQRQYWYADGDEPEGTEYTGIPHEIILTDPRIGFTLGARFGP